MRPLIIWGCGGHAREVNLLCEQAGRQVLGFLDERPDWKGRAVDGLPVIGDIADAAAMRDGTDVVCGGVGDPRLKARFWRKTLDAGFRIAGPLVHPGTYVSASNVLEDGVIVCAGVTMTVNIRIGANVCLNRNATVGHDTRIGAHSTINPGAVLSGNVDIGPGVYVGANAAIRERITIAEAAVVGGGAFVARDVAAGTTVAGVPARILRSEAPS